MEYLLLFFQQLGSVLRKKKKLIIDSGVNFLYLIIIKQRIGFKRKQYFESKSI